MSDLLLHLTHLTTLSSALLPVNAPALKLGWPGNFSFPVLGIFPVSGLSFFSQSKGSKMGKPPAVISRLLLIVAAVNAQTAQTPTSKRLLPQWLTGIIAVTGFLFLTFVGFLVKRAWCEGSSRGKASVGENDFVMTNGNTQETTLDIVRSKDDRNAYDNLVIDGADDKVTAM